MFQKVISYLPVLVVVVGVGLFACFFAQDRRDKQEQMARQKAAVADKTDTLPGIAETDMDRTIAEKAFLAPSAIDGAPPVAYRRKPSETPDIRYGDPPWESSSNSTMTTEQADGRRQPLVHEPSVAPSGAPNASAVYFKDSLKARETRGHIDPSSSNYEHRVEGLMTLRQRRVQGEPANSAK